MAEPILKKVGKKKLKIAGTIDKRNKALEEWMDDRNEEVKKTEEKEVEKKKKKKKGWWPF